MTAPAPSRNLSPRAWRTDASLSMTTVAEMLGLAGKNPARTYQRWEKGALTPPLWVIQKVEKFSGGRVTVASWAALEADKKTGQIDRSQFEPAHA